MVQTPAMHDTAPETMRHVPSPAFLADKIDSDVRRALELFGEAGPHLSGPVAELAKGLRRLARLLHLETTVASRELLESVVSALREADDAGFRRRTSETRFVRGRGERVWTASTALFATVESLVQTSMREGSEVGVKYHAHKLPAIPELQFKAGGSEAAALTSD